MLYCVYLCDLPLEILHLQDYSQLKILSEIFSALYLHSSYICIYSVFFKFQRHWVALS
jgi:hypothetical protein